MRIEKKLIFYFDKMFLSPTSNCIVNNPLLSQCSPQFQKIVKYAVNNIFEKYYQKPVYLRFVDLKISGMNAETASQMRGFFPCYRITDRPIPKFIRYLAEYLLPSEILNARGATTDLKIKQYLKSQNCHNELVFFTEILSLK